MSNKRTTKGKVTKLKLVKPSKAKFASSEKVRLMLLDALDTAASKELIGFTVLLAAKDGSYHNSFYINKAKLSVDLFNDALRDVYCVINSQV